MRWENERGLAAVVDVGGPERLRSRPHARHPGPLRPRRPGDPGLRGRPRARPRPRPRRLGRAPEDLPRGSLPRRARPIRPRPRSSSRGASGGSSRRASTGGGRRPATSRTTSSSRSTSRSEFPYVGTQLVWDTREDPLLGTRGLLASVDLQGSGYWLGSSFSYARVYGQANFYHPVFRFGAGRAVWAQSVRAGFARAFDGQELIPDVRFYAGGSYSVRGYPTESLGPREDLGGDSLRHRRLDAPRRQRGAPRPAPPPPPRRRLLRRGPGLGLLGRFRDGPGDVASASASGRSRRSASCASTEPSR